MQSITLAGDCAVSMLSTGKTNEEAYGLCDRMGDHNGPVEGHNALIVMRLVGIEAQRWLGGVEQA